MVRNKQKLIDHIRNTPFDELESELKEAGMDTYENTPNVVRVNNGKRWTKDEIDEIIHTTISDLKHHSDPKRKVTSNKNIKRDLFFTVIREMASSDRFLFTESERDGTNREGIFIKGYVRDVWEYLEDAYDLIHDQDFETTKYIEPEYRESGKLDKNGVEILEGSVIRADGYGSDIEDRRFYCVEYDEDEATFGSCIYGDFEPLGRYTTIEVLGHCEDYREIVETEKCSGNITAVLK